MDSLYSFPRKSTGLDSIEMQLEESNNLLSLMRTNSFALSMPILSARESPHIVLGFGLKDSKFSKSSMFSIFFSE